MDNLIKSVDVQPKIDVGKYDISLAYSTFKELPDLFDFSNTTKMDNMFDNCGSLQTIPPIDTSNVTSMFRTFYYCSSLLTLPELDTRKVENMQYMLYELGAGELKSLPKIYCDKCGNMGFYFCSSSYERINLTDVGGWINLSCNWNDNRGLSRCPNLTYQSCINILNGLADVTELGNRTLQVHQNFLDLVGNEISIGTDKGWIISAS